MKPWEELQLFDLPESATVVVPLRTQAQVLFNLWRDTYQPRAKWSDVRGRRLIKGLKEFGFDDCRDAILGMQYSEWHMGRNKAGQKYVEIRVALRNEDSVIRFGDLYRSNQVADEWGEASSWEEFDKWLDSP